VTPAFSEREMPPMRAVIQRVSDASVSIDGEIFSAIDHGLLILLGVEQGDVGEDRDWLVGKIAQMRIFSDEQGKMNRNVTEVGGSMLVVSQFTLHASTKKGNRPSFLRAAEPGIAAPMYEAFCERLSHVSGVPVKRGVFGADMQVQLCNDGPVTIFIDSRDRQ
jgi:D-aminoacyl-tRNA deacylase